MNKTSDNDSFIIIHFSPASCPILYKCTSPPPRVLLYISPCLVSYCISVYLSPPHRVLLYISLPALCPTVYFSPRLVSYCISLPRLVSYCISLSTALCPTVYLSPALCPTVYLSPPPCVLLYISPRLVSYTVYIYLTFLGILGFFIACCLFPSTVSFSLYLFLYVGLGQI